MSNNHIVRAHNDNGRSQKLRPYLLQHLLKANVKTIVLNFWQFFHEILVYIGGYNGSTP